ncbi:outer membrane beta-barrel protein, partial [Mesorhizobium sp. M1C.F.Ca.ET.187.01.1.1]|uniref:outer membrane beta-barrel protein n=1 Tax=Mesorhizobium sp. M1C.F.Ca.ET.187.01.1.1 TaxID=2563923 RepID=UPI001091FC7F
MPGAAKGSSSGIKVGTFVFRPTLEQGFTATSNADASSGGTSAVLSETALRFTATSDWRGTAELLRTRMRQSKTLIYVHSNNSPGSRWMPWELGFFD